MIYECFLLFIFILFIIWIIHILRHFIIPKFTKQPPLISGYIPFLGCAIEFGKGPPVSFIKKCQKKYGNTFTLHLAGRYLTFLLNNEDFECFFSRDETTIDFQYATQPFLTRCFGVPKDLYFQYHEKLLSIVRNNLLGTRMSDYIPRLYNGFNNYLDNNWNNNKEILLFQNIRELIFTTTLTSLFGDEIKKEDESLIKAFTDFDGWFEIASSNIPHIILPKFTKSKERLLKCVKRLANLYPETPNYSPPLTAEVMRQELGKKGLENWLLAMVWAGEANTIPTLFWCLYYLIEHPNYLKLIKIEINDILKDKEICDLSFKELMSITCLKNALNETIRLHSPPIIVRGTRKSVNVKDYIIPVGHFICLSPYWAQRNDNLFNESNIWNPIRWNDNSIKDKPFLAFGQGKYRCPGQSFAYCGMMVSLLTIISKYTFKFPSNDDYKKPKIDLNNLVGVTKPEYDIKVIINKL